MTKELATFITPGALVEAKDTPAGPVMIVGDQEAPLLDTLFQARLIQPGHVKNEEDSEKKKLFQKNIGNFYCPDMDLFFETAEMIPIAITAEGRKLFPPYGEGDGSLLCYSSDGIYPSPRLEGQPFAPQCAEPVVTKQYSYLKPICPYAMKKDSEKAQCTYYTRAAFLAFIKDDDGTELVVPLEMEFKGVTLGGWIDFMKSYNAKKNAARVRRINMNNYVIRIRGVNEGTFAKMEFDYFYRAEGVDPGYINMVSWYMDNVIIPRRKALEEQTEAATTKDVGSADIVDVEAVHTSGEESPAEGESFTL